MWDVSAKNTLGKAMLMKKIFLWLIMVVTVAPALWAADGIKLVYDVDGTPVVWTRDAAGTVQVDGLPMPGVVLYRPAEGTVYYQHPLWPRWLRIGPDELAAYALPLNTTPGAAWTPWQGQPTRRWAMAVGDSDEGTMGCGDWFASHHAAAVMGLNAADFLRVITALNFVNAGTAALPCDHAVPDVARAAQLGLPVRWQGGTSGTWTLESMARVPMSALTLPTDVEPLTARVKLSLMMAQLGDDERKDFVRVNGKLPVASQLEVMEGLLGSGESY